MACSSRMIVSARVIQMSEMAMGCLLVGKGFDSFRPLGPVVDTDLDPADQQLQARINGQVKFKPALG